MTNVACYLLLWEASFSTKNCTLNFRFENSLTIHKKEKSQLFLLQDEVKYYLIYTNSLMPIPTFLLLLVLLVALYVQVHMYLK
jgi:sulfur relay (sulfurtransferase) complex TusBCD TusD component (DsrE family)